MNPRIPSRLLRDVAQRQDDTETLDEFVSLLLDALAIDDVRDAVRARLGIPEPATPPASAARRARR